MASFRAEQFFFLPRGTYLPKLAHTSRTAGMAFRCHSSVLAIITLDSRGRRAAGRFGIA